MGDLIVGKAMEAYVQSEYGNLWETHQCRPHAYGHTWSPGFELPAGMLHGHAVACGMGWGAYLAYYKKFINKSQLLRIMRLISSCELSLWHDIMNNDKIICDKQVKIIEKRGGNLCAPLPKEKIGECGYLNELSDEEIKQTLMEYKKLCVAFPRNGYGVDAHCADVGLENPAEVKTVNSELEIKIEALQSELEKANAQISELQLRLKKKENGVL